jgi:ribosomal protection tetracycline resistance protein
LLRRTLNLGILAHVDAGKTTLTERLLYAAHVIDEIGSVDAGTTQTDSLALERQRGITIKSAVVSFAIDDVTINLIDTPGHPDFIAEVERVLSVLDGAVLVVSAVEGVQAQTRVLMRALQRLRIPTLIFVNKIDRRGAQCERALKDISERLTPATIAMGSVSGEGTRAAACTPHADGDAAFTSRLVEVLAAHDDALLAAYVDDETSVLSRQLRGELAAQTKRELAHPVFFGSAITGAGVDLLSSGITGLLPAAEGDDDRPVSGSVFKVERGASGEKIAYARVFSGTIRVRDRLRFHRDGLEHGEEAKVTAISVFESGSALRSSSVGPGQICKLWGLGDIQIGDALGEPPAGRSARHAFAPPTLESVVVPCRPVDGCALHAALTQLAEQDPLIDLRQDDVRHALSVSLYGEVQKEVVQATLASDFGIDVMFRETTTIYVERLIGVGEAVELLGKGSTPFLAGVGLRIEPAAIGTGVGFRLEVELGSMPFAFFKAIEETVRETLQHGIHGWRVADCTVTLTYAGYFPRQSHSHATFDKSMSSTAGDFRNLTPLVVMDALKRAGTTVYEPMLRVTLEIPADTLGAVLPALARLHAVEQTPTLRGPLSTVEAVVPAARVHDLERQLPALTRGEGVVESTFDHYQEVRGAVPTRPRSDHNPLDRKEYLLRVARRRAAPVA